MHLYLYHSTGHFVNSNSSNRSEHDQIFGDNQVLLVLLLRSSIYILLLHSWEDSLLYVCTRVEFFFSAAYFPCTPYNFLPALPRNILYLGISQVVWKRSGQSCQLVRTDQLVLKCFLHNQSVSWDDYIGRDIKCTIGSRQGTCSSRLILKGEKVFTCKFFQKFQSVSWLMNSQFSKPISSIILIGTRPLL